MCRAVGGCGDVRDISGAVVCRLWSAAYAEGGPSTYQGSCFAACGQCLLQCAHQRASAGFVWSRAHTKPSPALLRKACLLKSAKCCADDYDNMRHIVVIKETIFTKVVRSYFRYISSKQLTNIRALIFLQASKVRAALLAHLIHSASAALSVSRYICTPDKIRVGKSEPTA